MCPDGEVRVDSLSPAHTLSSVPSPCSLEALSPYSFQVSPCGLLFVLYSIWLLISNSNATIGIDWGYLHTCHMFQTLTAALYFGATICTLETLANKSLKHLVTLIMWCQSVCCPRRQEKGADNFSHISIIYQADVFTMCPHKDKGYVLCACSTICKQLCWLKPRTVSPSEFLPTDKDTYFHSSIITVSIVLRYNSCSHIVLVMHCLWMSDPFTITNILFFNNILYCLIIVALILQQHLLKFYISLGKGAYMHIHLLREKIKSSDVNSIAQQD